ncbi:hypothetical protein GCM10009629_30810 [Pseudonocardia alni]
MVTLYSLTEAQTPLPSMATAMGVLCAGGPIGTAAGQLGAGLLGATPAFVIVPTAAALGRVDREHPHLQRPFSRRGRDLDPNRQQRRRRRHVCGRRYPLLDGEAP